MKRNYAHDLYHTYEQNYLSNSGTKSSTLSRNEKGLFKRPTNKSSAVSPSDSGKLMQDYFNSVREQRNKYKNDTG